MSTSPQVLMILTMMATPSRTQRVFLYPLFDMLDMTSMTTSLTPDKKTPDDCMADSASCCWSLTFVAPPTLVEASSASDKEMKKDLFFRKPQTRCT